MPTLKSAFEPPYRGKPLESFTFGPQGIAGHLEKGSIRFTMEVDIELSDSTVAAVERQIAEMRRGNGGSDVPAGSYIKERNLRYCLTVEIMPKSGFLKVVNESLSALKQDGKPKNSRNPFLEKSGGHLSLRMEGQSHPRFHEIGLDHTIVSQPLYPPHYPHLVAFRQESAAWFCFYFEPRERMRAANPVKEVRHIGLMGEDLAGFLNTLKALEPAQFRGVEKAMTALIPRITGIEVDPNRMGEVELQLIEDTVPVPARLVSEGTLRLLGLLALGGANDPPTLVAFEEPENEIHPRRLELIAKFLESQTSSGKTQFVVTTHSPILLDLLPGESLFCCGRDDGRTTLQPFQAEGPLFRTSHIRKGLEDRDELTASISERILRGDFDA